MPVDFIVLGAALLTGLLGGAHCTLMCGGIATSLSAKTQANPFAHALAMNLGRIGSYTLAGVLAGLIGSVFVGMVRVPNLPIMLRSVMGLLLMLIALRMLFPRQLAFTNVGNSALWRLLSGIKDRLPQSGYPQSFATGALWGWLPCGLSTSVLIAAWFEASALHSGLMMLAFGLGTLPLMTAISWSGSQFSALFRKKGLKTGIAAMIFLAGLLTALAPLLMRSAGAHAWLEALGCRSVV
jgi:hypothetical protein